MGEEKAVIIYLDNCVLLSKKNMLAGRIFKLNIMKIIKQIFYPCPVKKLSVFLRMTLSKKKTGHFPVKGLSRFSEIMTWSCSLMRMNKK